MSQFIDKLFLINSIEKQLDFLFDTIDEYQIDKKYNIVDEYILEFNEKCELFVLYIGFLTITNIHKNKLKNREKLEIRTIIIGQNEMNLEEVLSSTHGLISDKILNIITRKEKLEKLNNLKQM